MPDIAIIGAGIRGLSSAAWLKLAGARITVFEKNKQIGGVWRRVHRGAQINTPSYGYTFHASNCWSSDKPTAAEILANLKRMVRICGLEAHIMYDTPVVSVRHKTNGKWQINDQGPEFDGVLVCTGFLGRANPPPTEMVEGFEGILRHAYQVRPDELKDLHVLIVGSGSSALDMLALARNNQCRSATLSIYQNVSIRDISRWETVKHAISSHPLLYRLTKRPGGQSAAVHQGIKEILADPQVQVRRDRLKHICGTRADFGTDSLPVDMVIWCTGWESGIPTWSDFYREDPSLVVAACPSCLDTAGFGFGSATAHAKALLVTLEHGLLQPFASGSSKCPCESDKTRFGRHILLNLALFFFSQPRGWKILGQQLRLGFASNLNRYRMTDESKMASLLAFFNAPFGF